MSDVAECGPFVFLVAGEASGDVIGAHLMLALQAQTEGKIKFAGVGGEHMQRAGLKSLFPMQELSVTVRGTHHQIKPPFFVLATQNPIELEGTYPLPEAQLDRFLFNVILDYLDTEDEMEVVDRYTTRVDIPEVSACTTPEQILKFQWLTRQVPVSETVNRFAVNLVRATRPEDELAPEIVKRYVQYGASVRATMFLTLSAKARALMMGRYHVTQDDIKSLVLPVMRHRVLTNYYAESDGVDVDEVLTKLVEQIDASKQRAKAS